MFRQQVFVLFLVYLGFFEGMAAIPSTDDHVQRILQNLTLKQKIGQMTQLDIATVMKPASSEIDITRLTYAFREYGVGSFLNSPFSGGIINNKSGWNVTEWLNVITSMQKVNLKYNSVPFIFGIDSVHGANYVYGATLFPHNLGIAATFNPELTKKAAEIAAKDTRAAGIPWTFSPVLDIGMMPLWARFYETFGEDPYVASTMGAAAVTGFQGKVQSNGQINNETKVAACMKHFIGYSDPKSGKDRSPAWIPDRMLYRYFVPSFKTAIDHGVATAMICSGQVNGIPVHASKELLTHLLRVQLKFGGMVVTDYQDIIRLHTVHHIAPDLRSAVKMAIDAGIDMSMVPLDYSFPSLLFDLVHCGEVSEARIEFSVTKILQLKKFVGLLDNPFPSMNSKWIATVGSAGDREISLQMARESITLLKNEHNVLPLQLRDSSSEMLSAVQQILVTGPSAHSLINQNGGWTIHWQGAVNDTEFAPYAGSTIFTGVKEVVEKMKSSAKVVYAEGCGLYAPSNEDEALKLAANSDVIIVAVGEAPEAEGPGDINDLTLPAAQLNYVQKLRTVAPTKIIVLVLVEARPRIITPVVSAVNAILMAYLPSIEGGRAIAEIIFGLTNPSGRLPFTYPAHTGDIGVPYYRPYSSPTSPAWEFGRGLSYTKFTYSNLLLSTSFLTSNQSLSVSVDVTNTGTRSGQEVVFLYLSQRYASVSPETKLLKRFTKVTLNPSQKQTIHFVLTTNDLIFIGVNNQPTIEDGEFVVEVGPLFQQFTYHA